MPSPKAPDSLQKRMDRADATDREARSLISAEQEATRKKTLRLRAARLARDAREGKTELDKPAPKRKPKSR